MNKKLVICAIGAIIVIVILVAFFLNNSNNTTESTQNQIPENSEKSKEIHEDKVQNQEDNTDMIKIKVNNEVLEVKLEENEATKSLVKILKNGDISVDAKEYGGFEKVGDLGINLPRNDTKMTTSAGDIVLYQGNQISLFYNSNSWSYTKLGKVQNVTTEELKDVLGSGDVTLILSID